MSQNTKSKSFTVALSMVICLFFLWAISNNLLSSVVKKMMTLLLFGKNFVKLLQKLLKRLRNSFRF